MSTSSSPHITCAVFNEIPEALAADTVHRFVVGEDAAPQALAHGEASDLLGDAFAQDVLLAGTFPRSAGEVLEALERLGEREDAIATHRFFLLGEGSQIPFSPETASVRRGLRFLVACGHGEPDGPDVLVSSFHPDEGDVELMAWDRRRGGFNFYRTVGTSTAWIFAGNSRHALSAPTQGNGPFESHRSGNLLMKELKPPWIHWESPDAHIEDTVFSPPSGLREHPWFDALDAERGALTCEEQVARPSIRRWTRLRFDELAEAGQVGDVRRVLEQVVDTPAVNIVSSFKRGDVRGGEPAGEPVDLPATFFLDVDALLEPEEGLGIDVAVPRLEVPRDVYDGVVAKLRVRVTDGRSFTRPGDTHFAFAVPERAFEDQRALAESRRIGLLTDRLAACLLMTDFPNPVFSQRRARLAEFAPEQATLGDAGASFEELMTSAILEAAETAGADSAEREFAALWAAGDDWRTAFAPRLSAYLEAVVGAIATPAGFEAVYRLAEARRQRVREDMAIVESRMLFSTSNVSNGRRMMREDATVVDVPTQSG